jgi:hypothetical protein
MKPRLAIALVALIALSPAPARAVEFGEIHGGGAKPA